jgi:murein DD-endopeptidase MepM/ murein hydrolase activator NlpD
VASKESALIPTQPQSYDYMDYEEWDTGEWNVAAGWEPPVTAAEEQVPPTRGSIDGWDTGQWNMAAGWAELARAEAAAAEAGTPETEGLPAAFQAPAWASDSEPQELWNPTEESTAPVRGRHRVAKQRTLGRGSAVFGVAAAAVLGVGGVAAADGHSPIAVSLPDLPDAVANVPVLGSLVADSNAVAAAPAPGDTLGLNAGEVLRTRILNQAQQQQTAAEQIKTASAERSATKAAAAAKVRQEAAAKKKAAAEAAKKKAAAAAAKLAGSYVKPVASYTLTAGFGETSSLWATIHTGQDFAAPTGTPIKAIHSGTITSAGWAGSYGYRIIETLDDGTELWYCHQSSMIVTSGKVTTGQTIGRVGATGNVTGPHLHLEVRPGGGAPIDPMPWLRAKGLVV